VAESRNLFHVVKGKTSSRAEWKMRSGWDRSIAERNVADPMIVASQIIFVRVLVILRILCHPTARSRQMLSRIVLAGKRHCPFSFPNLGRDALLQFPIVKKNARRNSLAATFVSKYAIKATVGHAYRKWRYLADVGGVNMKLCVIRVT